MRGVPGIRELRRGPTAPVPAEVEALTAGYEGGGPAVGLAGRGSAASVAPQSPHA
jgi:hypothetical protein